MTNSKYLITTVIELECAIYDSGDAVVDLTIPANSARQLRSAIAPDSKRLANALGQRLLNSPTLTTVEISGAD